MNEWQLTAGNKMKLKQKLSQNVMECVGLTNKNEIEAFSINFRYYDEIKCSSLIVIDYQWTELCE